MKANNINVNLNFLSSRAEMAMAKGYSKQKWIIFCEVLLAEGFVLRLYEARKTFSKYITVKRGKRGPDYKVRFSNHRPIKAREASQCCRSSWSRMALRGQTFAGCAAFRAAGNFKTRPDFCNI